MWNIIKKIFSNDFFQKVLLIGIIALLISMYLKQCEDTKTLQRIQEQNQLAMMDSLMIVKNKVGELTYEKYDLITSLDDLKVLNSKLYNQVDNLKGEVKRIAEIDISYQLNELKQLASQLSKYKKDSGYVYKNDWSANLSEGSFNAYLQGYTDAYLDTVNCQINRMESYLNKLNYNLELISYTKIDENNHIVSGVKPTKETPNLFLNLKSYELDSRINDAWNAYNKKRDWFALTFGFYGGWGLTQEPINKFYYGNWQIGIGFNVGLKILDF